MGRRSGRIAGMKLPKFSMATLMLLITIAAIMFASVVAWQKIATISAGHSIPMPLLAHLYNYVATASYWVPFGFLDTPLAGDVYRCGSYWRWGSHKPRRSLPNTFS